MSVDSSLCPDGNLFFTRTYARMSTYCCRLSEFSRLSGIVTRMRSNRVPSGSVS